MGEVVIMGQCKRCGVDCMPSRPSFTLSDNGIHFYGQFSVRPICLLCAEEMLRAAADKCVEIRSRQIGGRWAA